MSEKDIVQIFEYVEPIMCVGALAFMLRAKAVRQYRSLFTLLAIKLLAFVVLLPILLLRQHGGNVKILYPIYFYGYWTTYAVESIVSLLVIYSVYKLAMEPLKGLQSLGLLVFRWAAAISVAVAVGMAFGPHTSSMKFVVAAASQLQRTQSILTLCLVLFVTFAVRPMGLSHRSRVFGVTLGLGILSTTELVRSAWFASNTTLYTSFNIVLGIASSLTVAMWATYFALPEPERRVIMLPTTSPFLRWNQVSIALGHDPGYVAVGNVSPNLFAPAELEIMRRASAKEVTAAAIAN